MLVVPIHEVIMDRAVKEEIRMVREIDYHWIVVALEGKLGRGRFLSEEGNMLGVV